ncbi:succinyl-CoA synthetase subunit alpha [Photobacterium kishitanii]|nr:endonuclease/exonuclease/phosphatase family protein [Photobacterium kishitanii]PSU24285.1 succinyl-CoA synthetase subunit alpha [Photobacterium kishitanii]
MKMNKTLLATLLAASFIMTGCNDNQNTIQPTPVSEVKFAQFNAALAVDNDPTETYQRWVEYMTIPVAKQNELIAAWKNDTANEADHLLAERIIQIRNIAAIIQKNRPDVLLLNEFNNNGTVDDVRSLNGFQQNYLAVSQSLNSVDGGSMQQPIVYPYAENYATNTGLATGLDLDNNGKTDDANDAQGFGFYHGHYAFALLSKFEIDTANTRTFQNFKRKDLPNVVRPTIEVCDSSKYPIPAEMCNKAWFSDEEWEVLRLSSKNHVDAPIIIPTPSGNKTINVLLAHPTPSGFDTVTYNNRYRNSDENAFWSYYINGEPLLYDDSGTKGGFSGEHFVVMGDLNADNVVGTQINAPFDGIIQLLANEKVNQTVAQVGQPFTPQSSGGLESKNPANNWNPVHPNPEIRTSVFGSRADYVLPSASLNVIQSGIYWPAVGEEGRLLFNDARIGMNGDSKEVSSDHRFVWSTVSVK